MGPLLKQLRLRARLRVVTVARRAGISSALLQMIEEGSQEPDAEVLARLGTAVAASSEERDTLESLRVGGLGGDSLARWLRDRRSASGLSQAGLSAMLEEFGGCGQNHISVWELGRAIPDAGQMVALTRALGVHDPADIARRDELAVCARRDLHARRAAG